MEQPTVGRIVMYNAGGKVLPAIITHVYGPEMVNLAVFGDGSFPSYTSGPIELKTFVRQMSAEVPEHQAAGTWYWPVRV